MTSVEHNGRLVRVQVKSTMVKGRGGYSCMVRSCRGPYIIPARQVLGQGSIALYPQLKGSKYERYKEA
jgi:hypothetical protein